MAIVSTYSVGGSYSTITESREYSTLDEILIQLPNNSSGLIDASDVRDSVYTLWEKIGQISASVSNIGTSSVDYIRTAPSTIAVGGISSGSTFSGTVQDVLDRMLYPYVAPGGSLNFGGRNGSDLVREYGNTTGGFAWGVYPFTIYWSATVNTSPLSSIIVDGVSKPLSPLSGNQIVTSTHSSHNPSSNPGTIQSYTMSISDGTSTISKTASITWKNKIFWGIMDLTSIGNPNLTTNPGSASTVSSLVTSTLIKNLTGANANGYGYGYELSITKNKTYNSMNGVGKYLIFAWPSNMPGSYTPIFTVNNLGSSAFTRVRTNWAFSNQYSFTGSDYEVWISNTLQNSPLNVVIS